jgi:hypothetical protein
MRGETELVQERLTCRALKGGEAEYATLIPFQNKLYAAAAEITDAIEQDYGM